VISRDELHEAARAFDLHEANVQRDYVFGWLLSGIFRETSIADSLTLKGGNALRKGYLPSTRFSDDLDLSTAASLDAEKVLAELNRVCEYVQSHAGVQFDHRTWDRARCRRPPLQPGGEPVGAARLGVEAQPRRHVRRHEPDRWRLPVARPRQCAGSSCQRRRICTHVGGDVNGQALADAPWDASHLPIICLWTQARGKSGLKPMSLRYTHAAAGNGAASHCRPPHR
jgi:hypothetical protein